MARLVHQQRWWRFYEQVRNGAYKRHHGPNDSLVEAESRAREKTQHIQQVLGKLIGQFPHLADLLDAIRKDFYQ